MEDMEYEEHETPKDSQGGEESRICYQLPVRIATAHHHIFLVQSEPENGGLFPHVDSKTSKLDQAQGFTSGYQHHATAAKREACGALVASSVQEYDLSHELRSPSYRMDSSFERKPIHVHLQSHHQCHGNAESKQALWCGIRSVKPLIHLVQNCSTGCPTMVGR